MRLPDAEIEASEGLVRALVRQQAPHLAHLPVRREASGWDMVIHRLGDHLAVRLPRRRIAAELLAHEQRWLPVLAPRLGVPVPVPLLAGSPTPDFPWPWSVTPWFDGAPAALLLPDRGLGHAVATALADFLIALHQPAPADAPRNPYRGGPFADRRDVVAERLTPELRDRWDTWSRTDPWDGRPLWIHGDLHPLNVVVSGGHLVAVIDFSDLTAGDPAYDLAIAWLGFAEPERAAFIERIDDARHHDAATWTRARAFALSVADMFRVVGEPGSPEEAIGAFALGQLA